jgi:predicted metalloprotease
VAVAGSVGCPEVDYLVVSLLGGGGGGATAGRIGDDYIQKDLGNGRIDQKTFTHGTSAQRQRWFTSGYGSGDPKACDTFAAATLD